MQYLFSNYNANFNMIPVAKNKEINIYVKTIAPVLSALIFPKWICLTPNNAGIPAGLNISKNKCDNAPKKNPTKNGAKK